MGEMIEHALRKPAVRTRLCAGAINSIWRIRLVWRRGERKGIGEAKQCVRPVFAGGPIHRVLPEAKEDLHCHVLGDGFFTRDVKGERIHRWPIPIKEGGERGALALRAS